MPTPTEDIGAPTAHADGANVVTRVPVRCEIGQREASMDHRGAREWAYRILSAANEAERYEWMQAAEMK